MSLDLTILATAIDASDDEIRVQALRCSAWLGHPDGDLDARIVAFYEELREVYPDSGPAPRREESPWADSPLGTGIDHVTVSLRHGETSNAIATILDLAARHDLVAFDPQDETVIGPPARHHDSPRT
ncbi:hypothetical protein [Promicromonospora sp. NPDC023805]|uniref:hypothetical protein n=1 Tax=Promicromonospora sp. NPDC023805 TaxID=3154696 RepID=UPI00340FE495